MGNLLVLQLKARRNEALLQLDERSIRLNCPFMPNGERFWSAVHKTRTQIKELPREARLQSRQWLLESNLMPLDDDLEDAA